jgi:hypothetical protein
MLNDTAVMRPPSYFAALWGHVAPGRKPAPCDGGRLFR